jgi:hypothetical protein
MVTDSSGVYRASTLGIGLYTIEASKPGFKTLTRRNLELHVNEVLRIDLAMEVGNVTEKVEVTGEPPVVPTETGEISNIVDARQVVNLPLNGRNFMQLGMINPGVNQKNYSGSGGFSANGLPSVYTNVQLDSAEIMDFSDQSGQIGVLANFAPSVDAIAEFTMQTSSYGAEYGTQAGANVNVITKSGTNEFHGTAFEYLRNDKLDARNPFFALKPERRLNQYGGVIGGPIIKDKLFFFFSYEGTRKRVGIVNVQSVPTAEMKTGNFSAVLPGTIVRDPTTKIPFPGNIVPGNLQDSLAQQVLQKVYPLPTGPGLANNLVEAPVQAFTQQQYLPKIDWQISSKHRASFRYVINDLTDVVPWSIGGNSWCGFGYPGCSNNNSTRDQNFVINGISIVSPQTVANTQFMYMRRYETPVPIGLTASRIVPIPELSSNNLLTKMPTLAITGFAASNVNNEFPHPRLQTVYKVSEHFTRVSGSHTITFGGDLTHIYYDNRADYQTNGNFAFDGSATGYGLADFLTGRAFSYLENTAPLNMPNTAWRVEPYFQDRIKLRSNLTVGLGVRWALYPPMVPVNDNNSNWSPALFNFSKAPQINPTTGQLIPGTFDPATYYLNGVFVTGKDSPYGHRIVKTRHNNIAPRVDMAWDPTGKGKWSVRGGFGTFFDAPVGNYYDCCGGTKPPFSQQPTIFNTTLSNPGGGALLPQATTFQPTNTEGETTHILTWNFGVEHEILPRTRFAVSYVGNHGYHEPQTPDVNQPLKPNAAAASGTINVNAIRPYAGFSRMQAWTFSSGSKYHSMQVLVNKNLSNGFEVRGAYTWSKTTTAGADSIYASLIDAYDGSMMRGFAGQDVNHLFVVSYVWDLPGFRKSSAVPRLLLSGWTLTGITSFQSGNPLNVTISPNRSGTASTSQRPNVAGPVAQARTVQSWFDISAFSLPAVGTYGNLGYNAAARGPGIQNYDMGIHKQFPVGERVRLDFRSEWFNILNHPNYGAVGTVFGTSTFGKVTSARDLRIGQMALKLIW